jgi:polysaccharide deacetylase 2 family uncharacterized protein YibQ
MPPKRRPQKKAPAHKVTRPKRMVRAPRSPLWHLRLTGLVLLMALGAVGLHAWQHRPLPPPEPMVLALPTKPDPVTKAKPFADSLYVNTDLVLERLGLWPALIEGRRGRRDTLTVRVPGNLPLATVNWKLTQLAQAYGGQVLRAEENESGDRVEILCGFDSRATTLFRLRRDTKLLRPTGQIALVLDDFGQYSRHLAPRFCALRQALTLALLPNEGSVDSLAALALRHGHQVLLHLPMEPEDYPDQDPGDGAILLEHDKKTVRRLVRRALERVPGAVGVNNHMGSRATADARIMEAVLDELKGRGLFFLDSVTSSASVAYSLASRHQVKTARRDLFIDEVDTADAVRARLWELAQVAAEQGYAVGIGHDREQTLLALEATLPELEERGFRFVPVSSLVQ